MVTRILTTAAAALLMASLASPADAQVQRQNDFRGGGHVSNFTDCSDWNINSVAVTSRLRIVEYSDGVEDWQINVFSSSWALGWRNFESTGEGNVFTVQETGVFSNSYTTQKSIRWLASWPADPNIDTQDINLQFEVIGWPSIDPDCRATVRLQVRAR